MVMSKQVKQLYEFGPFCVDVAEHLLLKNGEPVALMPKAFDLLLLLVENSGRLMEKDDLMQRLWPAAFVEEANLSNNISLLRKTLGDDSGKPRYIETVPKRGYRFVARVAEVLDEPAELIIEEHTSATLTVAQETKDDLQQTKIFPVGRQTKRLTRWLVLALGLLTGVAWAAYSFADKSELTSAPIRSIAVLPFKPLVADTRDEALELGMSEMLITRLSIIKEVAVRPLSAVRKYTALEQDPIAAGHEQKVDAVLDGNLQKTGERLRATIRLVRVSDGQTLWADKFDEPLADLFALQDAISERVAKAMAIRLTSEERQLLTKHHTNNPEAYQLYFKGQLFRHQWTEESLQKALACYDGAIALDPDYALAYVGKADLYSAYSSVLLAPAEAMPKAREAAEKALQIDDGLAEAHRLMAQIKIWADWDWSGAERAFKRALEIKPNDAATQLNYSGFLIAQKQFDEALAQLRRAQELDPLSFSVSYSVGRLLYMAHQYEQAAEQYREVVALYPNSAAAHRGLGCALRQQGRYTEAIAELKKAVDMERRDISISELGHTYAKAGKRAEALKLVKELEDLARRRYVSPVSIARIYAGLGEPERLFEWLRKGYEDRSDHLLRLGPDPTFDGVRQDPRFTDLLKRVGLAP